MLVDGVDSADELDDAGADVDDDGATVGDAEVRWWRHSSPTTSTLPRFRIRHRLRPATSSPGGTSTDLPTCRWKDRLESRPTTTTDRRGSKADMSDVSMGHLDDNAHTAH